MQQIVGETAAPLLYMHINYPLFVHQCFTHRSSITIHPFEVFNVLLSETFLDHWPYWSWIASVWRLVWTHNTLRYALDEKLKLGQIYTGPQQRQKTQSSIHATNINTITYVPLSNLYVTALTMLRCDIHFCDLKAKRLLVILCIVSARKSLRLHTKSAFRQQCGFPFLPLQKVPDAVHAYSVCWGKWGGGMWEWHWKSLVEASDSEGISDLTVSCTILPILSDPEQAQWWHSSPSCPELNSLFPRGGAETPVHDSKSQDARANTPGFYTAIAELACTEMYSSLNEHPHNQNTALLSPGPGFPLYTSLAESLRKGRVTTQRQSHYAEAESLRRACLPAPPDRVVALTWGNSIYFYTWICARAGKNTGYFWLLCHWK